MIVLPAKCDRDMREYFKSAVELGIGYKEDQETKEFLSLPLKGQKKKGKRKKVETWENVSSLHISSIWHVSQAATRRLRVEPQ